MHVDNVIAEFSIRGYSVPCSNDSVNTGSGEATVFVWTIKSVMNGRAKDYQSLALKKTPVPTQCDGFMVCVKTTSIGVSMDKTVTGVELHKRSG